MKCLEKDLARRFADVAELAAALAPFAPPVSALSVERIAHVIYHGPPSSPRASTLSDHGKRTPLPAITGTAAPPASGGSKGRGLQVAGLVGAGLALVAIGGLVGFFGLRGAPVAPVASVVPAASLVPVQSAASAHGEAPPARHHAELRARLVARRGAEMTIARLTAGEPIPAAGTRGVLSREARGDAGLGWMRVGEVTVLWKSPAEGQIGVVVSGEHKEAGPLAPGAVLKVEWDR